MTSTQTLTLNTWTDSRGNTRRYINNWADLIGLTLTWRKWTLMGGTLAGETISRPRAYQLYDIKVWLDDTDELHIDGIDEADPIVATIRDTITAILAPEATDEPQTESLLAVADHITRETNLYRRNTNPVKLYWTRGGQLAGRHLVDMYYPNPDPVPAHDLVTRGGGGFSVTRREVLDLLETL